MKKAALISTLIGFAIGVALALINGPARTISSDEPPATLRETGLYADWDRKQVEAANRSFSPQYPLWTDGARKQRWIYLPPGTAIDGSRADAWQFPVGTRFWKEFSFGARTETRYIVRTRNGWRFATYVWNANETEAVRGGATTHEVMPGVAHRVPSEGECRACHGNGASPVLGFTALQLSPDRDPNAVHREPGTLDVNALIASGQLRGLPTFARSLRIAGSPRQRAALGYLHANCGHCHRDEGAVASVGLVLAQPTALDTVIAKPSKFMAPHARVAPGDADHSVVVARMRSRNPIEQMPPLGTQLVDETAVQLIATWIDELGEESR